MTNSSLHGQSGGSPYDPEAFEVFASHTTKYDTLSGVLIDHIAREATSNRQLRILDVGCGPGQLTFPLLASLPRRLSVELVDYTGVDSRGRVLSDLQTALMALEAGRSCKYSLTFIHSTAEDAIAVGQVSDQFDLILCSHMLYYVPRWQWLIRKLQSLLAPNCELCVILTASFETLGMIREIGEANGVSWCATKPTASAFLKWLRSTGSAFTMERHFSSLSLTSVAEENRERAVERLAMCFAFLSGQCERTIFVDAARRFLESAQMEFPLAEDIFWLKHEE